MIVLPAIDLKNGRCVRLSQGRADQEKIYNDNPAAVARQFEAAGAKMLHLVDLDGAFRGQSGNLEAIRAVRAAVDMPIELGGGMRSEDDVVGMLSEGINSVIVGTMAVRHPERLEALLQRYSGEQVQLGVDARDGLVAVQGWEEATSLEAAAFALSWKERGITRVIFTDIARDGMMEGPNLEAVQNFATKTGLAITASGGVSTPQDLVQVRALEPLGIDRVIIGKAIYEGTITLAEIV